MTIGLSTYAFFWQASDRVEKPLSLSDMIAATADAGVGVFQICDYPAVAELDRDQLQALDPRPTGPGSAGVGYPRGQPRAPVDLSGAGPAAGRAHCAVDAVHRHPPPDQHEAKARCEQAVPAYEGAGVTLALETYEQVPSSVLVDLVAGIDSPYLGICSDPANCVAALETARRRHRPGRPLRGQHAHQGLSLHPARGLGRLQPRRGTAGRRPAGLRRHDRAGQPVDAQHQSDHRTLAALAGQRGRHLRDGTAMDRTQPFLPEEQTDHEQQNRQRSR